MRSLRGRRAERINRALHELRRPLQALVLLEHDRSPAARRPGASRRDLLELAIAGLEQLDLAVNGGEANVRPRRVSCRELMHAALARCRSGRPEARVRLYWDAGPAYVSADATAVARALDNLLANALEHGSAPVVVTGAEVAGRLRLTIANRVGPDAASKCADPRRGHGIPVVAEVARAHGGRFALYRSDQGCVAALELPLADRAAALAA